ncbi:hypothetical protein IDVR_14430 [Intrasporangium sp. DVR]
MTASGGSGTASPMVRRLALPLVWVVRAYQRFVSPLRPPTCRFHPTCSAYAVESLERFGPLKGGWLAARRLGRCHPWTPGGVDPVPQTWAERNSWRPEHYRPPADRDGGEPHPPAAPGRSTRSDHPA